MTNVSKFILVIVLCYASILQYSCKTETSSIQPEKKTGSLELDRLNIAISKDTLDHSLLFERAKLYYENSYYDGAIMDMVKAIEYERNNPNYYHLLCDVYLDYYKSKDALLTIERCVELFPKRIPSLLKLSETQLILKQYENSLATTSRILTIDPQTAEAYFMMGMNLKSVPDIERAKVAFRKATEIDPELVDAWLILGQIYESENDTRALDYYEAATNVDSDNPATWHSKAYYLQNNGKEDEALTIYRKINLIDKNYAEAYLNAGILYLEKDSIKQAYDQFDILINISPTNHLAHFYRGICNEIVDEIELAKQDYITTLRLNPRFTKAQKALESLK